MKLNSSKIPVSPFYCLPIHKTYLPQWLPIEFQFCKMKKIYCTVLSISRHSYCCCCFVVAKSCSTLVTPENLWDFPGKNTGMRCHFLLQGIFLTQGLNPCLLHWKTDSLPLSHQEIPNTPYCILKNG